MNHNISMDGTRWMALMAQARGGLGLDGCTPGTAVRAAFWYASRLINVGWAIRHIGTTEHGVTWSPRRQGDESSRLTGVPAWPHSLNGHRCTHDRHAAGR